MAKQKKQPDKNPEADDMVIDGTAEHVEEIRNDTASEQTSEASSISRRRKRLLLSLCVILTVLTGMVALGVSWINRLAVEAINVHVGTLVSEAQQKDNQLKIITGRLDEIDGQLSQINDDLAAYQNINTADREAAIDKKLAALESQISKLETDLTIIDNQLPQLSQNSQDNNSSDMLIIAQQLAELEQRVNTLEGASLSSEAPQETIDQDNGTDQSSDNPSNDQEENDYATNQVVMPDAIFSLVRMGDPYAELLDRAVLDNPAWEVLRPWAEAPPPSLSVLWEDLEQMLKNQPSNSLEENAVSDESWWSWLMSPLNDAITITPITPTLEAMSSLTSASEQRDAGLAIEATRKLSDTRPEYASWQDAMIRRQALDEAAALLAAKLEE